jgi:hypothetical protein
LRVSRYRWFRDGMPLRDAGALVKLVTSVPETLLGVRSRKPSCLQIQRRAVAYFAVIAGVGMVAALVLTGSWLHPGDVEW